MKIVRYYNNPLHANIDREKLEAEGLRAAVLNEHAGIVIPLTQAIPSLRPHLVVADEDYRAALDILGLPEMHEAKGVDCPYCGSPDVKIGFGGGSRLRKFLARFIFFPIAALFGLPIGGIQGNYYCRKCHKEFAPDK